MSPVTANDDVWSLPGVELAREGSLTEQQIAEAQLGINRTNPYVPYVSGGDLESRWLLKEGAPVGMVTLIDHGALPDGARIAEIGARFWNRKALVPGAVLDSFIEGVLGKFDVILVRCYWDNRALKRLLQRSGFRLARIEREESGRDVETHAVSRSTYLGRKRFPYLEGGEANG